MSVHVERSDRIITVILSRPEVRNAVNPEHADALYQAFLDFDADESAAAAIFWGEGGAFCADADLKALAARDPSEPSRSGFPKTLFEEALVIPCPPLCRLRYFGWP